MAEKKFNKSQYNRLKDCMNKGYIKKWNDYRTDNQHEKIELEGAPLKKANLNGANLNGAILWGADLQGAELHEADLQGAELVGAILRGAELWEAKLQGANFHGAELQNAEFNLSHVDCMTIIDTEEFDKRTDFTGVGLDAATIDPGLKAAFKNNIRRIKWQQWAKDGKTRRERLLRCGVDMFWQLSDYGSSTGGIIKAFFLFAIGFGIIYWLFAMISGSNGIIEDLRQLDGNLLYSDMYTVRLEQTTFSRLHTMFRALYFSIVTMTTLGFGDMHAVKSGGWPSYAGYLFLSVQVILGYVLLGALVTRLGVLFTSEAPAANPTSTESVWRRIEQTCIWRAFNRYEEWQKGLIFSLVVYSLIVICFLI